MILKIEKEEYRLRRERHEKYLVGVNRLRTAQFRTAGFNGLGRYEDTDSLSIQLLRLIVLFV